MKKSLLAIFLLSFSLNIMAQGGLKTEEKKNQKDESGIKQGFWSKKYRNGNLAYEITFKDGKPVGEMKRYHENGKLKVIIKYDEKGEHGESKFYDEDGFLVSEGFYYKKLKNNTWKYYSKNRTLMQQEADLLRVSVKRKAKINYLVKKEEYKKGIKCGKSISYFPSGQVAEETNWKGNKKNGSMRQYFPSGNEKTVAVFKDGQFNGVYYVFYKKGNFNIKGKYKNGLKDGVWIYYNQGGKVNKEIVYNNGVAENQAELDSLENLELKKLDKNSIDTKQLQEKLRPVFNRFSNGGNIENIINNSTNDNSLDEILKKRNKNIEDKKNKH